MTKKLLFVTTILLVVAIVAFAADFTGKWTYETAGRNGGAARQTTITLKQDGTKLTGTVPGMGGRGDTAAPPDTPITNGKVDGNNISFDVEMTMGDNKMVTNYTGTLSGADLKLKISRPGRNGGDPQVTEVTAKKGN